MEYRFADGAFIGPAVVWNGIGMADTRLLDEDGRIGRAVQTLLVAERQPG
jgi:hypothetical protein